MSRWRTRDRWMLGVGTALWLACFGATLLSLDRPVVLVSFYVAPAPGADDAPRVTGFPPWSRMVAQPPAAPRVGDRVLAVGGVPVAGAGRQRVAALAWAHTNDAGELALEVEREGRRLAVATRIPSPQAKWPLVPVALGFAALASGGLVLAPRLRLTQVAYPAFMAMAFWMAGYFGREPAELLAAFWVRFAAFAAMFPLAVRLVRFFPDGDEAGARWARGWPVLLGLNAVAIANTELFGVVPAAWSAGFTHVAMAGTAVLVLLIATQRYRGSGARVRRRFRWLLLGTWIAFLPAALAVLNYATRIDLGNAWLASQLAMLALPVAGALAVWRDDLLDVDRWLTGALVLSGLGVLALLGLAAGVPAGAPALAQRAAIPEASAALLLTLGGGAALAALGVGLWGRVRRLLLRQQADLEDAAAALLAQLAACRKPREVLALLADRLPGLWRATGAVVRAEEPALLGVLEDLGAGGPETAPLPSDLAARVRNAARPVSAALASGSAWLVPLHCDGELAAVVELGPKRNGDVYTPHDRALLAALAARAGQMLSGFAQAERLRAARARERELAEQTATLGRASETKSTLLAAAGHDLRQPLHAMGLFLGALEERVVEPEARALLERVRRSARSLGQMFDGLLDAARIDAGVLEPERRFVPLGSLLAELESEWQALAEGRGLALRVRPSRLAVVSDPLLLRSILQNLVGNALRYTERGGVLVGARRRGGAVRIEVWDTGPGIEADERARLFRAFERGRAGRDDTGVGLGLALVEKLASHLGHDLGLASRPGRGSCFHVSAPEAVVRTSAQASAGEAPGSFAAGRRAALLDDDPEVLEGLAALLEGWGFEVVAARTSDALLAALRAPGCAPEVLLADLRLADGTLGLDAIERVRATLARRIPALVLSADRSASARALVQAQGLLLLPKPVEPARLRAALAHLLGASR